MCKRKRDADQEHPGDTLPRSRSVAVQRRRSVLSLSDNGESVDNDLPLSEHSESGMFTSSASLESEECDVTEELEEAHDAQTTVLHHKKLEDCTISAAISANKYGKTRSGFCRYDFFLTRFHVFFFSSRAGREKGKGATQKSGRGKTIKSRSFV